MTDAPDLIVTDARVWPGHGGSADWAEAFACRDGRILALGTAAHDDLLSFGVTSGTEASIRMIAGTEAELRVFGDVIAAGGLHQRTHVFLIGEPDDPAAEDIIARRHEDAHPLLDLNCIKIHLDGVPTDGHTEAMLQPYEGVMAGRDDDAARFGLLLQDPETLALALRGTSEAGRPP
jgi:predicted amidohydrolase YtcJ